MTANICKVLLIDDDEDDYIVTRDFLDEAEQMSFKLTWVDNYDQGLIEIAKDRHDVYLLDFRLGKGNGLELLEEAIAKGCKNPIILLTGLGDSEIDRQAMASGASDYLVKGRFLSATLLERSIIHAIERKRSENRQLQLVTELAAVNQELKDFAYIVSHDLKAPLRGIASLAEWMLKDYGDRLDDEGKNMLNLMGGRVRRMSDLIDGVLQYSHVGRVNEEKSMVDLQTLVHDVIEAIAPPKGIKMAIDTELPMLIIENTRIQQLFQNLLSNAIKYIDQPEGEIHIGHRETNEFWEFYVSDTGVGIEERHFDKIFQIFQTLTPSDQSESTGVGLAIVKKIVELYGGHIWVKSQINQGSTFYFTLPISADIAEHL
jgi:signal transduction histidine kinase